MSKVEKRIVLLELADGSVRIRVIDKDNKIIVEDVAAANMFMAMQVLGLLVGERDALKEAV